MAPTTRGTRADKAGGGATGAKTTAPTPKNTTSKSTPPTGATAVAAAKAPARRSAAAGAAEATQPIAAKPAAPASSSLRRSPTAAKRKAATEPAGPVADEEWGDTLVIDEPDADADDTAAGGPDDDGRDSDGDVWPVDAAASDEEHGDDEDEESDDEDDAAVVLEEDAKAAAPPAGRDSVGGGDDSEDSEDEELLRLLAEEDAARRSRAAPARPSTKGAASAATARPAAAKPAPAPTSTARARSSIGAAVPASTAEESDDSLDESDDEHSRNTLGKIPLEWYDDFPHIGYDLNGERIWKPAKGDELESFLNKMEDPDKWWRTMTGKDGKSVTLTEEEIDMIRRITAGQFPDAAYDPYEDWTEFYTRDKMVTPLNSATEPKRRFVPSKWEAKKVMKLVRAIRNGHIKLRTDDLPEKARFYDIWASSVADAGRYIPDAMNLPAPKIALPGHRESYNPPPEYLWNEQERAAWDALEPEEQLRRLPPKRYSSLRHVPAYNRFVQERFERCMDLYLAPRMRKNRLQIDPESLLPKLPRPRDLRPFPTAEALRYEGHLGKVRALSVDPTGQWLATGSDDRTVRVWEVATARCVRTWTLPEVVVAVRFNPSPAVSLLAAVSGTTVYLYQPLCAPRLVQEATDVLLREASAKGHAAKPSGSTPAPVVWTASAADDGLRVTVVHPKPVKDVTWHHKGDYFATVAPDANAQAVVVHQLSKHQSQTPFRKLAGPVQRVLFHPSKPLFFVATQRIVRVYNLVRQELAQTLQTGMKWVSSLDVHPLGDNLIVGSYDRRLCWFDTDLSTTPYKVLRFHAEAIRQVAFHRRYPLFASCSDDTTIHVFHGMVYNDLMQNPLIVPVKILRGHKTADGLGVLDCQFHPTQPWLFSAGADGTVRLYT